MSSDNTILLSMGSTEVYQDGSEGGFIQSFNALGSAKIEGIFYDHDRGPQADVVLVAKVQGVLSVEQSALLALNNQDIG